MIVSLLITNNKSPLTFISAHPFWGDLVCHFKPTNECGLGYKPGLPFTCDVVEVVETVEVKAAGFLFGRVWTLSSHAGGSDGVC